MKNYFALLISLSLFAACTRTSSNENAKQEIINTDKEFCNRCVEKGMYTAFTEFADDSVIKPDEGAFPIIGKKALEEKFANKPKPDFELRWEPVKAEVATSGDLGYTFGNWKMKMKTESGSDTIMYGNYITIWKKQIDGQWKYVFDTGNNTPATEE